MSKFFMQNPRLMVLLIALIVVSGCVAIALLPRQEDPRLTSRAGRITTVLPGANALRVESLVTEKLEEELLEIEEIKELTSNSSTNQSFVSIELRDDITADEVENVWAKIRDSMEAAHEKMPRETQPSNFKRFDITASSLLVGLRWNKPSPPDYGVLRRALKRLKEEINQVEGTEKTELYGDPDEEILVTLAPDKLTALNLSAAEVSKIISASDSKVSAGLLRSGANNTLLEIDGELDSLSRIGEIPIQLGSGSSFISLEDIAKIEKTIRLPVDSTVLLKDQPAIVLGVQTRASSRIDYWAARVNPILEEFKTTLPEGVVFETVFEQSPYVETRLNTLFFNLFISAFAVALVIFFMMGWRSALIIAFSLPLVSLMVLASMNWLQIPMHQMSITGLVVALGLMIDNAIVMVDEIAQRLQKGETPLAAVSGASSFLITPLVGATITTTLSFAPIMLMGGPAGEFVGSIAMVTAIAVISSLILAITVTAPLAGIGLSVRRKRSWLENGLSITPLTFIYRKFLGWLMRVPVLGVVLGILLPVLGLIVALDLPEQFFPVADRSQFQLEIELAASGSLDKTIEMANKVRGELLADERVKDVVWFIGESAPVFYYNLIPIRSNASQYGQAIVTCHPGTRMRELLLEKQTELEGKFPGGSVLIKQLEQGPAFFAPIEVRLEGSDLNRLRELGEQIRYTLTKTECVHHTKAGLSEMLPKISFAVDEQQARLANLDYLAISERMNTALEGITGGSIMDGTEELPVRVRVSGEHRSDLNKIASMEFLANRGRQGNRSDTTGLDQGVPLAAISRMKLEAEYATITRINGRRMNEVEAYIDAGVLPATVLQEFREKLKASGFEVPAGYSISYGGAEAKRDDAVDALIGKALIIVTLMIASLVIALGSFRFAASIFMVAGLSVGLGLGSLWLADLPWGFMSIVAIMGMIGVAVNDSIVVLSSLLALPPELASDRKAITNCIVENTRHILATTFTTIAGFTPLILSGNEFWTPVAVAMSGGVGGATIIALMLIPAIYVLIHRRNLAVT
ncbi:MAG: efflux RND transporter permease subunit [Mariniblastus sp.]